MIKMLDHPKGCACWRCEELKRAYEDGCKAAKEAFGKAFRDELKRQQSGKNDGQV